MAATTTKSSETLFNHDFTPVRAANTSHGPLHFIHRRELGLTHRHLGKAAKKAVFQKLPSRLASSLGALVDETVLQSEGYVFLGFSKSGDFLISYNHYFDSNHEGVPVSVYHLQWWHFRHYKRLKLISDVRLFGEEEVFSSRLFLQWCEWPLDDTKVMVVGHDTSSRDTGDKHQCYVSILAVPSLRYCDDCSQLAILRTRNQNEGAVPSSSRCLTHTFTVHTKYELARPYPQFIPTVQLQMDGVAVFNTGDSIVALCAGIEDNHGGFGFQLLSPRQPTTHSASNLSVTTEHTGDVTSNCDSRSDVTRATDDADLLLGSPGPLAQLCTPGGGRQGALAFLSQPSTPTHRERHLSAGKENTPQQPQHALLGSPPGKDVYNFDADPYTPPSSRKPVFSPPKPASSLSVTSDVASDSDSCHDSPLPRVAPSDVSPRSVLSRCQGDQQLRYPGEQFPRPLLPLSQGSGRWESASSTGSSCVSSTIILQNETQCFTYSVRRYVESLGALDPDPPAEHEEDMSLAYHSILPLEVTGANGCSMRILNRAHLAPQLPCMVVKQFTFDVENYLGEAIRATPWCSRFLALNDYDAQIVEVNPDSAEVVMMVSVVVRTRAERRRHSWAARPINNVCESTFTCVWSLKTGQYRTLHTTELVDQGHPGQCKVRGRRLLYELRRRSIAYLPTSHYRSVHSQNNASVIQGSGKSKEHLLDRHNYAAVVLGPQHSDNYR